MTRDYSVIQREATGKLNRLQACNAMDAQGVPLSMMQHLHFLPVTSEVPKISIHKQIYYDTGLL